MIANYLQTNVSVNCLQKVSMSCLQLCLWFVSKNHVDELSCRWIVSIPYLSIASIRSNNKETTNLTEKCHIKIINNNNNNNKDFIFSG